MRTIGIVAHSAEGGALCFQTACREGQARLGPHLHPTIVVSAIPMGLSMDGWRDGDHAVVGELLSQGVRQVAAAGAEFYVCPDNTAHIVLEPLAATLPIPGLHIADVVGGEIRRHGWTRVGLLGTEWTMTGPVYPGRLAGAGVELLVPDDATRADLHDRIFDELCQGIFEPRTTDAFLGAIEGLAARGAEAVILGCTEIPLIVSRDNSPLPVLDSTRLLAAGAVTEALEARSPEAAGGWLRIPAAAPA